MSASVVTVRHAPQPVTPIESVSMPGFEFRPYQGRHTFVVHYLATRPVVDLVIEREDLRALAHALLDLANQ